MTKHHAPSSHPACAARALTVAMVLAACSSGRGSSGGQPLGGSCDPSVAGACTPVQALCAEAVCDPVTRTCVSQESTSGACAASDGGDEAGAVVKVPSSVDGGVGAPCQNSSDCGDMLFCIDGACFD